MATGTYGVATPGAMFQAPFVGAINKGGEWMKENGGMAGRAICFMTVPKGDTSGGQAASGGKAFGLASTITGAVFKLGPLFMPGVVSSAATSALAGVGITGVVGETLGSAGAFVYISAFGIPAVPIPVLLGVMGASYVAFTTIGNIYKTLKEKDPEAAQKLLAKLQQQYVTTKETLHDLESRINEKHALVQALSEAHALQVDVVHQGHDSEIVAKAQRDAFEELDKQLSCAVAERENLLGLHELIAAEGRLILGDLSGLPSDDDTVGKMRELAGELLSTGPELAALETERTMLQLNKIEPLTRDLDHHISAYHKTTDVSDREAHQNLIDAIGATLSEAVAERQELLERYEAACEKFVTAEKQLTEAVTASKDGDEKDSSTDHMHSSSSSSSSTAKSQVDSSSSSDDDDDDDDDDEDDYSTDGDDYDQGETLSPGFSDWLLMTGSDDQKIERVDGKPN